MATTRQLTFCPGYKTGDDFPDYAAKRDERQDKEAQRETTFQAWRAADIKSKQLGAPNDYQRRVELRAKSNLSGVALADVPDERQLKEDVDVIDAEIRILKAEEEIERRKIEPEILAPFFAEDEPDLLRQVALAKEILEITARRTARTNAANEAAGSNQASLHPVFLPLVVNKLIVMLPEFENTFIKKGK